MQIVFKNSLSTIINWLDLFWPLYVCLAWNVPYFPCNIFDSHIFSPSKRSHTRGHNDVLCSWLSWIHSEKTPHNARVGDPKTWPEVGIHVNVAQSYRQNITTITIQKWSHLWPQQQTASKLNQYILIMLTCSAYSKYQHIFNLHALWDPPSSLFQSPVPS